MVQYRFDMLVYQMMRIYCIEALIELPSYSSPEKQMMLAESVNMLWESINNLNPEYSDLESATLPALIQAQTEMGIIAPICLN